MYNVFFSGLTKINPDVLKLKEEIKKLKEENKRLKEELQKDAFTGLFNKTYILKKLESLCSQTAIIICDIDHFKKINDTYGHMNGDIVLKEVSKIINYSIRKFDIASRFGGEEFLIICPNSTCSDAYKIAERIRKNIEYLTIKTTKNKINITMSFGVSEFNGNILNALEKADSALYKAKNEGRNRTKIGGVK